MRESMLPGEVARRYATAWPSETLPQRTEAIVRAHPDRVALTDADRRFTFAEMANAIDGLSSHFVHAGVRAGDVVSWQLPNWWEAAVVHHAALRAGAISNPLNPAFRERELSLVVAQARPRVLVVPRQWRGFAHEELARTLDVEHVLVVRGDDPLPHRGDALPPPPDDPAALALLLYTSGTTSDPKGVLHTHRSLLYQVATFSGAHALTPEDRYLGGPPVAHIAGLSYGILAPFALGTSTALLDRWDPATALETAARERATFMTGPPTFLLTMAEALGAGRAADLGAFRLFSTGGASIPTEAVREAGARLGCMVKRAYGSTEVPFLTATAMDDDEHARLHTDGRALGLNEVRIESGEILARSPGMLAGYQDGTDAFTADGWFRTGDLGALDERGFLRVTGRLKDIIIRGGENISAKEIEDLLLQHPGVREAAVVGVADARLGERVCAVIAGEPTTLEDLTAFLLARGIAKHKLPERVEFRETLPKTESGKVRKEALRAHLA
jgi:cyclohexanecarboxylate-CoA ligase